MAMFTLACCLTCCCLKSLKMRVGLVEKKTQNQKKAITNVNSIIKPVTTLNNRSLSSSAVKQEEIVTSHHAAELNDSSIYLPDKNNIMFRNGDFSNSESNREYHHSS